MSKADTRRAAAAGPPQRSIIATPLDGGAVHVVIGVGPGQRGPCSFITDAPGPDKDMVGPPAAYLALAGWAA